MDLLLIFAFYYGSALLPLAYLLVTRFRGGRRRVFVYGLAFQLVASFAVIALADLSRRAGQSEWYWAMALNIPVNILFAIAYTVILCRSRVSHSNIPQHTTTVG